MTTETDQRLLNWLTLLFTPGLGPVAAGRLRAGYGSIEAILAAGANDLQAHGLRRASAEALARGNARPQAQQELARIRRAGLHCLTLDDPAYPALLREINDPPLVLYGYGDLEALRRPAVAVVGSRAATTYGKKIATRLGAELAEAGCTVLSGGALGIDSAAHQGALEANGATAAVLGCGLDVVYPPQNRRLFQTIGQNRGLLLGEYPLGTKPEPFRFPARNRIISGLAIGCVVVEAARRSGALITAEMALEQGREVFAVPGRVDTSKSEGCHRLIQEGAKLVHASTDILRELAVSPLTTGEPAGDAGAPATSPETTPPGAEEQAVLAALDGYPRAIEQIIADCRLPAPRVNALLLELEVRGLVESSPGPQYRLVS
ncbi:MAG: DNA-processing protein DprA [Desulfurivibrio sp.]|nr:DNA-processing protein DprA [Desulfurivibrio sp.]